MSSIGIINSIPWIVNLPGQGGSTPTPPVTGSFVELQANLFLVALEDQQGVTDKVELE